MAIPPRPLTPLLRERGDEARLNLSYTFKKALVSPPKRQGAFFMALRLSVFAVIV